MEIKILKLGPYQTNCYILYEEYQAIVIDPGVGNEVLNFLNRNQLRLHYILNTHGHGDHTGGDLFLKKNTGAPVLIHKKDDFFLKEGSVNLLLHPLFKPVEPDGFLKDGEIIKVPVNSQEIKLEVIHTPGHTPGSVSFISSYGFFSGDTVFKRAIGRFDFPYASAKELKTSLEKILFAVPLESKIYPGHGPTSSLKEEEEFLRRIIKELSLYETES